MPPIEAPQESTYRCVLEFSGFPGSGIGAMTTGFWVVDDLNIRTLEEAAVDIAAHFVTANPNDGNHERQNRPSTSQIALMRVSTALEGIFGQAPVEIALGLAGADSGAFFMPPDTTMVASLKSAYVGPAFRGRMYWPHIASAMLASSEGLWNAAACTRLNTTMSQLRTTLAADDYTLAVVSRFVVPSPGAQPVPRVPPLYAPVTSGFVDRHVDVQRRRGVR